MIKFLFSILMVFFVSGCEEKSAQRDVGEINLSSQSRIEHSRINFWQSYTQSPLVGIHKFVDGDFQYSVERIPSVSNTFHSGYGFINNASIVFDDRANNIQYKSDDNRIFKTTKNKNIKGVNYKTLAYLFKFDFGDDQILACLIFGDKECSAISIKPGTFPYVYATHDNSTLVVTNYGDALLFRSGKWCRMSMKSDVYVCLNPQPDMLDQPREVQFYSSIDYQGRTLVGEWPTGRIYEFDGLTLKPSDMTPPRFTKLSDKKLGFEAQSMAEYCGDLFVGYWPKGELWRYDHRLKSWGLFQRFFTATKDEAFIPYSDRKPDGLDSAFFGQRITALLPFQDSLYVVTSNLRSWNTEASVSSVMNDDRLAEYGSIYKISRAGCESFYMADR